MTALIPAWVDGKLTPVGKLAAHEQGLRHKAISVFVMDGSKTLLQQRALGKYHTPGLWANACCTHPHWDEASLICAVRRLEQELGITGLEPQFKDQIEYRADVGGGLIEHEVVDVFTAAADQNLRITPNPDEVMDFAWVDLSELRVEIRSNPAKFTPWLRIYLVDHYDSIFNANA
ncbi:isopentenyl-diphosphate Delta-isomerase [Pelagimonas phthalicica]|uniref:isopentenyl-diphosphate Delta-isomerase n=1 Tax=Pelagimonas phthalicica TaxID=1037362 RepID=UPI000C07CA86|nr:isopentenyl-diphosphate Delta-isomerase [Pelagimonas phthalicica]